MNEELQAESQDEQASPSEINITVDAEANVYSQSGEDGIIANICSILGIVTGTCVDVGAWDGVYLSNTAALRLKGWKTCLIEQDKERFYTLVENCLGCTCINQKVDVASLDGILEANFPHPIDVLSVDIDGDDIYVFKNLVARPRILVIEYNPTFPPFVDRENPLGAYKGSSLKALERVGLEKEYDLVYATISNAIFVDRRRNGIIAVKDSFGAFRWDLTRFVASDFDGTNYFTDIYAIKPHAITNPWSHAQSASLGLKSDQKIAVD